MARPTNPLESFFWGAGGQPMTEEEIAREREIAQLLTGQVDMSPVGHWTQGAARMAQALAGRVREGRANRAAGENADYNRSIIESLFSPSGGSTAPVTAAPAPSGPPTPATSALMRGTGGGGDYFAAIRAAESGGNDAAKNPLSSATGRYQFIQSTWDGLRRKYPELGLTPDGRTDPEQQERAIKAFTADNAAVLQKSGIPITGGNLYAAHFLGADGARNVLTADPGASVASIVGQKVVNANPFLRGMSVADFQNWAAKKGGSGPVDIAGTQPAAPVQVASLDPSIGMPEQQTAGLFVGTPDQMPPATAPVPQPRPEMTAQAMPAQMMDPQGMGGPAQGFVMPQGMPQQAPAPSPQPAQAPGIDPRIIQALSDPRVDGNTKRIAMMLLQQQQAAAQAIAQQQALQNDPLRQLQIQKGQLELEAMRNPKPPEGFTLGEGQIRFDAEGNRIAEGAPDMPEPPSGYRFGQDGMLEAIPGGPADPTIKAAADQFKGAGELRKEIQALPSYKNISQAVPIYKSMVETAGRNSRASDLNLVYGIGKIMDPTSVVREGEMVMVKNTGSLPDWLQGAISSLNGGAALTPETRNAIMMEAYGRMKGYQDQFLQDASFYRGIVDRNKFNPEDVIPSFTDINPWTPPEKPLTEMTDEELEAIANGNR